jgi:GNAT superfamily N-acetyltransferase
MLLLRHKEVLQKMASIRLATDEDIPRILDLYHELTIHLSHVEMRRSAPPDYCRQVFAEICADPRHELLVAEDQGEIVGTVVLLIVPNLSHSATPWALVENIVVGEKYRRRGFGRLLLEYVVSRAREKGCHRIELCSDKRREEAHQLYQSVGFEESAYGFRIYF